MGKKVYILGGAGFMATPLTLDLASHLNDTGIEEMVIGDINPQKARTLAQEIGDKRVRAEYIDVTSENEAADKIRGFDLLVNCLFYELDPYALRIACKAKVDYTDINGGPLPNEEKSKMCRDAGIRAIDGIGVEQTINVLLGKKGASQMDSVEEMHTYFCSFRNIAPSPGLLSTILWENAWDCPDRNYYYGGRLINAGPFEGSKKVKLPDPVGEQTVYYMSEAEVAEWAYAIPSAKYLSRRGVWRPEVMRDIEAINRLGLQDNAELNYRGQNINIADFVTKAIWRKVGGKVDRRYPWGYMFVVEVIGVKNGELKKVVYSISHPDWQERSTANMVGISAAVNVILLLNKGRDKIGFFTKWDYHSLDDLEWLIKELATRGIIVKEG